MTQPYLNRDCPACGGPAGEAEATSEPRAEALPIDELRPYWSGLFKEKLFFSYHRCEGCGLLFAPRFFTDDQLGQLYSSMAPNMDLVPTDAIEATQRGYFDEAARSGPLDGGYLEIGPDIGYIVRHAAREGAFDRFWLFEPNKAVHAQLDDATGGLPHDIRLEMDDLSAVPDGSVGLAVMIHVLDHLLDPKALLSQIAAKLKPGGRLLIVTHNEASVLRRVMRRRWPPFCLQHPELYNPASITALLNRSGFGSVRVERSVNHFPLAFMARQAAYTVGMKLDRVPLPQRSLGLRLGNLLTIASSPEPGRAAGAASPDADVAFA